MGTSWSDFPRQFDAGAMSRDARRAITVSRLRRHSHASRLLQHLPAHYTIFCIACPVRRARARPFAHNPICIGGTDSSDRVNSRTIIHLVFLLQHSACPVSSAFCVRCGLVFVLVPPRAFADRTTRRLCSLSNTDCICFHVYSQQCSKAGKTI